MFTIISGAQNGADMAALDAAIELGVPHGGFCPRGRKCEAGLIPEQYVLQETESGGYEQRTELNVIYSNGTAIFNLGVLTPGSALTSHFCEKQNKPYILLDPRSANPQLLMDFIGRHAMNVLNVAGSRESKAPGIYQYTYIYMLRVILRIT